MKILKEVSYKEENCLDDNNNFRLCWDDDFYGGDCGCDD